jgi:hypothetical protein
LELVINLSNPRPQIRVIYKFLLNKKNEIMLSSYYFGIFIAYHETKNTRN